MNKSFYVQSLRLQVLTYPELKYLPNTCCGSMCVYTNIPTCTILESYIQLLFETCFGVNIYP